MLMLQPLAGPPQRASTSGYYQPCQDQPGTIWDLNYTGLQKSNPDGHGRPEFSALDPATPPGQLPWPPNGFIGPWASGRSVT